MELADSRISPSHSVWLFRGTFWLSAARGAAAVTVVDVSNQGNPLLLSSVKNGVGGFEGLGTPARIAFQGNTLWIADNSGGVTALDLSNPSAPILKCAIRNATAGFNHLSGAI